MDPSWLRKFWDAKCDWQEPCKTAGPALTCAAGSYLGDSALSWAQTAPCWAVLWCLGFFLFALGAFFPSHRLWVRIHWFRQLNPHTGWNLAGQSKSQQCSLPFGNWTIFIIIYSNFYYNFCYLYVIYFLIFIIIYILNQQEDSCNKKLNAFIWLFTGWSLNAQGIKSVENGIKERLLFASAASVSLLFQMWGWEIKCFFCLFDGFFAGLCCPAWESCDSLVCIWPPQSAMAH